MPTTPKRSSARCCPQGYSQVETPDDAGLVLYNTCSIRDKAEQKVFNRLQNFKREAGKGKIFGVLGLRGAAGRREDLRPRAARFSLVAGSASYTHLGEMLVQLEAGNRRVTGLSLDTDETFDTPFTRRDNPHRAYLTIIEGCDKSCAYCVVPFTRGPERSRTSESVMAEARGLAEKGYTEIQLLGQNVNSYRDPSPAGWDFATLLARVAEIPGMRRVRYTTCHPRDFVQRHRGCDGRQPGDLRSRPSAGAVRLHAACWPPWTACTRATSTCAASSGSRTRKRRYSLTTDIIVGFPGETDEDFQQTLDLLDEVQYDSLFSFKYSPRPNTAALADGRPHPGRGEAAPPADRCRRSSAPSRSGATRS